MAAKKNDVSKALAIDPFDLSTVAMASSPRSRSTDRVTAVDVAMRNNYDILRAKVAVSLRPVIVVQFDFSGGTYNLVTRDRQLTVQPVPRLFEQIKSICHCPLGIYTVVAPYLNESSDPVWRAPLQDFGDVVRGALEGLGHLEFPEDVRSWSSTILESSDRFITECLTTRSFTMDLFRAYAESVFDSIRHNMMHAASLQVSAVVDLLLEWRNTLGPTWRDLYAAVLTTWTIEEKNQHWLVLRMLMDQEMLDERLYVINVGNARENTVDVALMNLAIIVQDKIAGHLVFGKRTPIARRLNVDLATRNDLLSSAVEKTIDEILCKKGVVQSGPK
jgi:hypothetical protein